MGVPVLAGFGPGGGPDAAVATRAALVWLAGGIVGLPTETVYGLAADAQNPEAIARVYQAKGRPADHPLIVHVQGPEALPGWSAHENPAAVRLVGAFWPGPLTVIVARNGRAGDFVTGGQGTVALRCPDHPVARACIAALARESGDPARGVAAPSANRFGRVSPTSAADVVSEVGSRLDPEFDLVVDGGPCAVGVESTIVDCTADPPRVLRPGAISQAQVDAVLAGRSGDSLEVAHERAHAAVAVGLEACVRARPSADAGPTRGPQEGQAARIRAPGTLESHYAPNARVVLIDPDQIGDDPEQAGQVLLAVAGVPMAIAASVGLIAGAEMPTPAGLTRVAAPSSAEDYARGLYAALRRVDELGLDVVVAVQPDPAEGPLAHAVRDRLARAAHPG